MLVDLTIKGFLAETASNAPVPGGGSISALNGAIATALTEMVANLTIGKKKYADVEGQMRTVKPTIVCLQPLNFRKKRKSRSLNVPGPLKMPRKRRLLSLCRLPKRSRL